MTLELIYANGQLAALERYKLGFPAHPTVANSAVLTTKKTSPTLPAAAQQGMAPPSTPMGLSQIFDAHEQGETRSEPRRKLSADNLCTSCRRMKHYGKCSRPRAIPEKAADLNIGMQGYSPEQGNNPSTSPNYRSAVSSISSLTRALEGRPADEQAASGFADLYRGGGISNMADEPGQMSGSLAKVANKLSAFMLPDAGLHSMHEQRGPTVNPYEEQRTRMGAPVGFGDEGLQRINRAFNQIDHAADTTNIGGGAGDPEPGPAVLG